MFTKHFMVTKASSVINLHHLCHEHMCSTNWQTLVIFSLVNKVLLWDGSTSNTETLLLQQQQHTSSCFLSAHTVLCPHAWTGCWWKSGFLESANDGRYREWAVGGAKDWDSSISPIYTSASDLRRSLYAVNCASVFIYTSASSSASTCSTHADR